MSTVSPFSISVSLDFPYTSHVFLPQILSKNCQGLRRTFSEISTKCDATSYITPKYKDVKIRTSTELREIVCTGSQDMLVLSSAIVSR
jgi:hypothetical protein